MWLLIPIPLELDDGGLGESQAVPFNANQIRYEDYTVTDGAYSVF